MSLKTASETPQPLRVNTSLNGNLTPTSKRRNTARWGGRDWLTTNNYHLTEHNGFFYSINYKSLTLHIIADHFQTMPAVFRLIFATREELISLYSCYSKLAAIGNPSRSISFIWGTLHYVVIEVLAGAVESFSCSCVHHQNHDNNVCLMSLGFHFLTTK